MTAFYDQEFDSEEEYLLEALNDNYRRHYVVDINYNRTLKHFPLTLNKIEEVDETTISGRSSEAKDENGNPLEEAPKKYVAVADDLKTGCGKRAKERPKSASFAVDEVVNKEECQKRPRSSCANYPSRIPVSKSDLVKKKNNLDSSSLVSQSLEKKKSGKNNRVHNSWEGLYQGLQDDGPPERSACPCGMRPPQHYDQRAYGIKRSNSQPNISRKRQQQIQEPSALQETWCEVSRFKRSLRLLGLSSSDFGLPDSPKNSQKLPPRPRSSHSAPTFCTKVLERSISLDSLREIVRESAYDRHSGLPQRQLLAQAAYEEWYFKKESEIEKIAKQQQQKTNHQKLLMEEQNRNRQQQAGEKFQQWLTSKQQQDNKKKTKKIKLDANLNGRLMKSKEEIDKAYLEWKKKKVKDIGDKKQREQQQLEKEEHARREKEEKRQLAEKVFKEWKKKLEETEKERKEKETAAKEKLKEVITTRSTKTNKSFKVWKEMKEDEIKMRWKNARNAAKKAEVMRSSQLTERMYEAEGAFDEWLDKVDTRRQKQLQENTRIPKPVVPWAPA